MPGMGCRDVDRQRKLIELVREQIVDGLTSSDVGGETNPPPQGAEGVSPCLRQHQQVEEAETIAKDQQDTAEDLEGVARIHTTPRFLAR